MNLSDSEVLYLSQVLFFLKNSNFDCDERLTHLLERCELHFESSENRETYRGSLYHDDHCVWNPSNDEEDAYDSESESSDLVESISLDGKNLLELEPVKVITDDGSKFKLFFEKGISKSAIDISLDDGHEILGDVETIIRTGSSFTVTCVEGTVTFEVQKFPKSWTSLMSVDVCYKITEAV